MHLIFFYLFSISVAFINGAKILGIFPLPAKSHFTYNDAIMKALVAAGHEVVVMSPFPHLHPIANYSVIDMSKDSLIYVGRTSITELRGISTYQLIKAITEIEEEYCHKYLNLKEVQELLSNENSFDVIILEVFILYRCFLPLAEKLKIPIIGSASQRSWVFADHVINNPNNPSFIPSEFSNSWKVDSFYERLINCWKTALTYFAEYYDMPIKIKEFQQMHKEFHSNFSRFSLVFYNTHFSYFPRPMNPNAIEIGGIHIEKEKPLPERISRFIEESDNVVILFSLGSMITGSSMDSSIRSAFLEAFAQIPQRVIWKYEDKMENVPENVLLLDWLPQRDILANKKVKAFISHCGQSGTYEAIYTGTPIVALSLFGDQHTVASILDNRGVAVRLEYNTITKQSILNALNAVINDTKYYEKMQQLSEVFKDRSLTPQQSAVYWTEYVIRHKGAHHLESAASQLYWFQYFLLDVIGFFIFTVSLVVYLLYCVIEIIIFHFTQTNNVITIKKTS